MQEERDWKVLFSFQVVFRENIEDPVCTRLEEIIKELKCGWKANSRICQNNLKGCLIDFSPEQMTFYEFKDITYIWCISKIREKTAYLDKNSEPGYCLTVDFKLFHKNIIKNFKGAVSSWNKRERDDLRNLWVINILQAQSRLKELLRSSMGYVLWKEKNFSEGWTEV